MRYLVLMTSGVCCLSGCLSLEQIDPSLKNPGLTEVRSNPFSGVVPFLQASRKIPATPGDPKLIQRVIRVGNHVLDSNSEIGLRPSFGVTGSTSLEVFHHGPNTIYITEGLIEQCQTDEQLAAILCHELGEMVFERELLASPKMRQEDERPPMRVQIGNAGQPGEADFVHLAEVARYEKRRNERRKKRELPNPEELKRQFLRKAGFRAEVYDEIKPLLKEAERTYVLEKQFKANVTIPPQWNASQTHAAPKLKRPEPTEASTQSQQPRWSSQGKKKS
ncbi:MAG: M48 family metalloprotease [Gemmataceae bacterium]